MVFNYTLHNWSSDAQDENGVSDKGGEGRGVGMVWKEIRVQQVYHTYT